MSRWTAPDLTDGERADLEAINALGWPGDDEQFKAEWAALKAAEDRKASEALAEKRPAKRAIKAKGGVS